MPPISYSPWAGVEGLSGSCGGRAAGRFGIGGSLESAEATCSTAAGQRIAR